MGNSIPPLDPNLGCGCNNLQKKGHFEETTFFCRHDFFVRFKLSGWISSIAKHRAVEASLSEFRTHQPLLVVEVFKQYCC